MNVICPCMKTTYTFEALVEAVAVQAGLDTSVPEDHTKACELATWMLDEGYSSIVLTHAAEFAEEKGVPAKWIALVSAIIGAVIAFFCTTGCANTSFTLSGEQGGQISYSVDEPHSLRQASCRPKTQEVTLMPTTKIASLLQVVKDYKEIVILFAPLVCCFFLYQDNVKMRQDMLKLQQDQAHATLKISEAMAQQVELIRRIDYTVTSLQNK